MGWLSNAWKNVTRTVRQVTPYLPTLPSLSNPTGLPTGLLNMTGQLTNSLGLPPEVDQAIGIATNPLGAIGGLMGQPQEQQPGEGLPMPEFNPMPQLQAQPATPPSVSNLSNVLPNQLGNLQAKASADAAQYPAMPNNYGLGTPTSPITTVSQDAGSRSFNPWSLQGEANARGN